MAKPLVCVAGSLNMDLVVQTPALPAPGETILGGPFATFPGGKGANQAVAAARAGAEVRMIGAVGDDAYGSELLAGLEQNGVETREVLRRAGVASGVALIAVAPGGQNTIIVAPGANGSLTDDDIDATVVSIANASVLLLQLEIPLRAVARAIWHATNAYTRVILNPAPAQRLPSDVLAGVDFVVPNETEAALMTGVTPVDWESAEEAARRLVDAGAHAALITMGQRGALLWQNGVAYRQPAFEVSAVDATAAGDAFLGAFAVAIAEERPPLEAMRRGAAAGALAATTTGAQPSLPTRAEIDALLAAQPG
jgi:ribokinase